MPVASKTGAAVKAVMARESREYAKGNPCSRVFPFFAVEKLLGEELALAQTR